MLHVKPTLSFGLVLASIPFFATCGRPGDAGPAARDISVIQHAVFIIKENHTFDNYFGTFPGADGATSALTSTGQVVPLTAMPDRNPAPLCNAWSCALLAIDGGKMDKFDLISNGLTAYTQASEQNIPNYWAYARQFAMADKYFTSVHGPSIPNYLYAIAAQSGGVIDNGEPGPGALCDGTPYENVEVIDNAGNITYHEPCFDFQTLADNLENAGLTWKYYSDGIPGGIFDWIRHVRDSPTWTDHVAPSGQFLDDVQRGQLPAMSWLFPASGRSEHPPESVCEGENWTVQQLNAVMQSSEWNSTVVFITWDDFGGFYDHASPPQPDLLGFGPRVPLLIISPYAKTGYISDTVYEHSSVLKFVETRYHLPALTARDRMASDMLDSFDFNQPPQPPLILQARTCP